GTGGMHSEDSPVHTEKRAIEEVFGSGRMAMVLVPEGDRAREAGLARALRDLPRVASVISYSDAVSLSIPPEVLPPRATEAFYEGGYARLIVSLDTDEESDEAFEATRRLRETAAAYYPGEGHVIGETAVNEDLMSVITRDTLKVLLAGILSIGIVLLINFRNLTIPLILLVIIQGSIWLNMALPYAMGQTLNYIGYLIVSSVQLGATVDYGILLTQRYVEFRRDAPAREAAARAVAGSAGSVIPPAMILTIAGLSLRILVPDNGIISELGLVLGRGTLLSLLMVLLVLPVVLVWCDRLIQKTTLRKKAPVHEE
ncbi:MAG TPA: MMPL family transporter, partial [Candidatus Limnocylindria bacterium]|nr:MMPL family transporter [Candidatus Limnocylindria bacterium]